MYPSGSYYSYLGINLFQLFNKYLSVAYMCLQGTLYSPVKTTDTGAYPPAVDSPWL